MRDWIIGLKKAATEKSEGIDPMWWFRLEGGVNAVPDDLRDLYEVMDGAHLPPDVVMLPFFSSDGVRGVVERSVEAPGWTFAEKGASDTLITARKKDLPSAALPDWGNFLRDEDWLYAVRSHDGSLRFYRTLEQLLTRIVPPAVTEEFGEVTFAKALSAVQSGLGGLGAFEEVKPAKTAKPVKKNKKASNKSKKAPKKARKDSMKAKKASTKPRKKAASKKPAKKPVKKPAVKTKAKKKPVGKKKGKR